MKYIVVLGDGMSGLPLDELDGKTTLEAAKTPVMDEMAGKGEMGMVQNVPAGMAPGSDVANLAVMGYDPGIYYSGRSPVEALSIGVPMEDDDVIFRCNLVTLSEEEPYAQKTIIDHSSGEISSEDADILMDAIRKAFNSEEFQFYSGTAYRHICVWKHGKVLNLTPPHDHLGKVIGPYLPAEKRFRDMMEQSFEILNNHPLNLERAAQGKNKGNSLWFWGAGTKPHLKNFHEKTGKTGAMVSAVDLLKGLAVGMGMKAIDVAGATGSLETNYEGKAQAAIDALLKDGCDFAYIHLEGPDEMAHQGKMANKVKSIEYLDSRIVAPVKKAMEDAGEDFRMLILPDHPNPICYRTHTADPVPYILYDSTKQRKAIAHYSEKEAMETGIYEPDGYKMMERLLQV